MVNFPPFSLEVFIDSVHEKLCLYEMSMLFNFIAINTDCKILSHDSALNSVNDCSFKSDRELLESFIVI